MIFRKCNKVKAIESGSMCNHQGSSDQSGSYIDPYFATGSNKYTP